MRIVSTILILTLFSTWCFAQEPGAEKRQHSSTTSNERHRAVAIAREINQKSASLLDSLSALDLPDELTNLVDSLRSL